MFEKEFDPMTQMIYKEPLTSFQQPGISKYQIHNVELNEENGSEIIVLIHLYSNTIKIYLKINKSIILNSLTWLNLIVNIRVIGFLILKLILLTFKIMKITL